MTDIQMIPHPAPEVFGAETALKYLKDGKCVKTTDTDAVYVVDIFTELKCELHGAAGEPFNIPLADHFVLMKPSSGKPAWMSPCLPVTLSGFMIVSLEEMSLALKDMIDKQ